MGLLSTIIVSFYRAVSPTQIKEIAFHSCTDPNNGYDVAISAIIGGVVLICVIAAAITVVRCVKISQEKRNEALRLRQNHELAKMDMEQKYQESRCNYEKEKHQQEHEWKIESDDKWKDKELDLKLKEKVLELRIKEEERRRKETELKEVEIKKGSHSPQKTDK